MFRSSLESEIKKFSAISKEWWKQNGKFKVLHNFNNARIEFISQVLQQNKLQPPLEILDVGCGGGILAEPFAKQGFQVTGIDASLSTILEAKKHATANNLNINYLNNTPEEYLQANPNKQFPIIFATEIIEHVPDPKEFLKIVIKLLQPNGLIVISTINRNIQSLILAKYTAEYILGWLPKNIHDFAKFITPKELSDMLEVYNSSITHIKGINFKVMSQDWVIANKPTINYICVAKKANN
ncbi:Ubiquinone biosynthesis O-methyltransferase [Candidatus Hepatincola sp. Av]